MVGRRLASGVWTGTEATGLGTSLDCEKWTTAAPDAKASVGRAVAVGTSWSHSAECACDLSLRLYCFEVG